jgi:hypothetical protein
MSRRLLLRTGALTVLLCAFGSIASAASLTIQWDANVESDLAGYVVRYGTSPGTYTTSVDVGRQISARVSNLVTGTRYYAVVEAYNTAGVHGARSGEVAGTATDPATVMTLTLKFIGNGEGILSAAGVSCSDNCTVSAAAGTTLTLSPVSNINSIFSGWEGSGCATGVVTIRASMTCSGRFSQMVSPTRFDANGDGRGDLLNYRATDGLTQVLRTAASGHGATTAYQSTWPAKWVLRAGDFNGDGRADVFAFDPATGAWQTALGDAQASLGVTRAASFAPAANVYVVDLNRDGLSDVFLHDPASGAWQKCLSTAAGFSCEAGTWPAGWEVYPLRTKAAAAGDLLLYNRSSGAIQKATNRATGFTLQAASVGAGWDVFTADFDGDGNADLIVSDFQTPNLYWFRGNGAADFAEGAAVDAGGPVSSFAVSDVNRDGSPDIITANTDHTVSVLLNRGACRNARRRAARH